MDKNTTVLLKELTAWRAHTGDTALSNLLGRVAKALKEQAEILEKVRAWNSEHGYGWADNLDAILSEAPRQEAGR